MPRRVILLPAPPGRAEPGRTSPATIIWFYFALTSWKSFKFFHTHRHQWSTHTVTHSHAVTPLNTRANALLTSHSLLPLFVFPSLSNVFFQLPHTDKVFNFAAETHLAQCESAPSLKCEIWNLIPLRVLECLLNIKCVFCYFFFYLKPLLLFKLLLSSHLPARQNQTEAKTEAEAGKPTETLAKQFSKKCAANWKNTQSPNSSSLRKCIQMSFSKRKKVFKTVARVDEQQWGSEGWRICTKWVRCGNTKKKREMKNAAKAKEFTVKFALAN